MLYESSRKALLMMESHSSIRLILFLIINGIRYPSLAPLNLKQTVKSSKTVFFYLIYFNLIWRYRYPLNLSPPVLESDGMIQSTDFILQYIQQHGPFDGLMGFSQGAAMVTRIALLLQQSPHLGPSPRFLILIGGVQPIESRFNISQVRVIDLHPFNRYPHGIL